MPWQKTAVVSWKNVFYAGASQFEFFSRIICVCVCMCGIKKIEATQKKLCREGQLYELYPVMQKKMLFK